MNKYRLLGLMVLFLGLIIGAGAGQPGLAQSLNNQVEIMQVSPEGELVSLNVSVVGPYPNHFAIRDLPPEAFTIFEDETSLPLADVPTVEEAGLAVVIVIDRSGSMNEGGIQRPELRINSARNAAIALVDRLTPETDLVGVIGFHTEIGPEQPLSHDTGAARNILYDDTQMGAEEDTKTTLYKTLYQALDWLVDNPDPVLRDELRAKRKAILAFTDGRDTDGTIRPGDVRDKALAHNVPIYTVGVDTGEWDPTVLPELVAEFDDAEWIARTTDARFLPLSSPEENAALMTFYDGLMTQKLQYRLRYRTQAGEGAHAIKVEVTTANDVGEPMKAESKVVEFQGRLQMPQVQIIQPTDDYPLDLGADNKLPIEIAITYPDGVERPLEKVEYILSGDVIGTVTEPPYSYIWEAPPDAGAGEKTLIARIYDSFLKDDGSTASDNQIRVRIIPLPTPTPAPPPPTATPTFRQKATEVVKSNAVGLLLVPVVLVLLVLLILTRRQVAQGVRNVTTATTGVLKGVTRRLGAPSDVRAKLTVTRGTVPGREFRIDLNMQVVRISRDKQFGDFALEDDSVSNPHCLILQGINQGVSTFYLRDEGSTNGTRLNQQPLQPGQQYLLQHNSVIEVGGTLLSFKQFGQPTQQFPRPTQKVGP